MYEFKLAYLHIFFKILTFCLIFTLLTTLIKADDNNNNNGLTNKGDKAFIAIVNDEEILLSDLLLAKEDIENQILQNNPKILSTNNLVEMLINRKYIAQQAKKEGLDRLDEYQKRLQYYQDKALYDVYYNNLIKNIANMADAKKKYIELEKNAEKILQKRVKRIVFVDEATASSAINEHKKGVSFEDLILKHSTKNTKKSNGDLGFFSKSDVVPQFAELIFSLNVDEISKTPIKAEDGYHIIKITEQRFKPFPKFEDVKKVLLNDLKFKKAKKHMDKLREKYQIIYHSSLSAGENPEAEKILE